MERNEKKKYTQIDRFARKWYCDHARLNLLRHEKKAAKRKMRKHDKQIIKEGVDEK